MELRTAAYHIDPRLMFLRVGVDRGSGMVNVGSRYRDGNRQSQEADCARAAGRVGRLSVIIAGAEACIANLCISGGIKTFSHFWSDVWDSMVSTVFLILAL